MNKNKGLLLAMMEPSAGFEEEFHDWYDTEHLPERVSFQGFENGQRFVCVSGFPRYVALYDLKTTDALNYPDYLSRSGDGTSPWTLRVRNKVLGSYRYVGTQLYPGTVNMGDAGPIVRLALLRFRSVANDDGAKLLAALRENFESRAGVSQLRLFQGVAKESGDFLATVEFHSASGNVDLNKAPFGGLIKKLDLVNTYTPYWRANILPSAVNK